MSRCKEKTRNGKQCIKEIGHDGRHTLPKIHECHCPTCTESVPPAMWGCKKHWFKLPKKLRNSIWREYNPGQEITKKVSQKYMDVILDVQDWCIKNPD
jgi:hypothetical protein